MLYVIPRRSVEQRDMTEGAVVGSGSHRMCPVIERAAEPGQFNAAGGGAGQSIPVTPTRHRTPDRSQNPQCRADHHQNDSDRPQHIDLENERQNKQDHLSAIITDPFC